MKKLIAACFAVLVFAAAEAAAQKMDVIELVRSLQPWAWYPLNDVTAGGRVASVTDASGNGRSLIAAGVDPDRPLYVLDVVNGRPVVRHNEEDPLDTVAGLTVKHVFVLTRYTGGANFGAANRGLLTESAAAPPAIALLVGLSADTKFIDLSIPGLTYYKAQTSYAAANQQAPFARHQLVELSTSTGVVLADLQLGQKNDDDSNRWIGDWADLVVFDRVLSADERRRVNLYFDLKYDLWRTENTALYFPDPLTTDIRWSRFHDEPTPWENVTVSNEYEDGGRSFNTITGTPPKFWDIEYTGLSPEEAEVFDAFADAARRDRTFSLIDKYGDTWTGVRIVSYERSHDGHMSWVRSVKFRLAKYPE